MIYVCFVQINPEAEAQRNYAMLARESLFNADYA